MRWLGIGERPAHPPVPTHEQDAFYEAERRNREAVIQARLSNRRLRNVIQVDQTREERAIADLMEKLTRHE
jgi:hypothetical protein